MIKRVFFDRLNEVAEDVVRSIRMRRQRDLAETRKVSFDGGVQNEPRVLLPVTDKRRSVNSSDNVKNSTWRGPRAPRRPTTTTRRHVRRGFHNRKVVVREQDAMWKTLLNDASALIRTEEDLHNAQATLSRIRNEQNQALTDVKKLSEMCDRLRRDRNNLKATMEDIVKSGGGFADTVQFEGLQEEVALLKDEKARLSKIIEHDKAALRAAEEENTAMTLQISLMNEDFDDKNAVIEALESASVEMMKEHANLELLHLSAKAELEASKSVITTMKVQHDAEQKVYKSRIQCLKSRASTDGADVNSSISCELALAKERIAFLEKAYKEKSEALKRANQEQRKPTLPNPPKQTASKPSNAPKWGFEPPDDLPMSQPYWDYRNAYSDHIAAMVMATVSAIPHIPLSSAISSAISTVSKAGPPPELAKGNKSRASRSSSPAPSKTPPPVIPKPSPPPAVNYSKLTMAQVVAGGASFSGGSEASAVNAARDKKKYTWRALETSKQIVTKPGAKGTRTSELHLRIPRCPATADLYKASGSRLVNAVIGILNKSANSNEIQAYKANPITSAKWSARSNLLLKCAQPLGEMLKVAIECSIRKDIAEGQVDEDSDVEVLNRPPTTSLKFMAVPRFNEDGSPTNSADLFSDIKANPAWADVSFFSDPKFLSKDRESASGIVVLTIVDDDQGNVGRHLMRSVVSFSGATRPCLRWVDKQVQPFCGQCMMWGHGGYNCTSNVLRCSKCGEGHDYKNHEKFCDTCQKGVGHICVPKCFNCLSNHFATSKDCEFYRKRTDRQWQVDTFKAKHPSDNTKKRRDENRARNKAANNTLDWVKRRMAGDYSAGPDNDNDDGFTKVGKKQKKVTFPDDGVARIDTVEDDWNADDQRQGSISPISYIDQVIASHAPEHMNDASVKTKSRHVEEEISRIKKRLEDFRSTSQRTRESGAKDRSEESSEEPRSPSSMIITPNPPLVNIGSHKHMRYLFQNVHKSRKTVHDLLDSRRNAIDILFIQEAPINFIRKVPSATNPEGDDLVGPVIHKAWICVDRRLAFPGSAVAIYVNKCITASYQMFPMERPEIHQDVLILQLRHNFLKGYDFTVINVYNRPARANAAVQSLLGILPSIPNAAVIQGDFNLHSPLWDAGIQRGSNAALQLYTEMSDLGLNLLNSENEPTWTNGRGSESVLDLLFISDRLCPLDPFVEMSMENRGRSDHALISCLFGTQLPWPGTPYIAKYSEEEDELCFFIGSILAAIPDLGHGLDVEDTCRHVSDQISEKWNSLAKTPITSRPHGTSWWNEECQAYRDTYNIARTKENFKAYNAVTRKARAAFFEAKIAVMTAIKKPWEGLTALRPMTSTSSSALCTSSSPRPPHPPHRKRTSCPPSTNWRLCQQETSHDFRNKSFAMPWA
ncbi:hypothetical protein AX14_004499 [Amanita brunnescens Koide BX004]|nr:hypothetical protein AX14_004499 [Amanita brunnescens Koide BX004]